MAQIPQLAKIRNHPSHPVQMFKQVIGRVKSTTFPMSLATLDNEFGVMNRTVMYRGLIDDSWICFVTERNSRKYSNLKKNPKLALTMLFMNDYPENDDSGVDDVLETWQVRLVDAAAVELDEVNLKKLWQSEPLIAKIRSHICECGRPRDPLELDRRYRELMRIAETENREPEQTSTYTAFKIVTKLWDFYKSEADTIADRLQYKEIANGQWEAYHVDP